MRRLRLFFAIAAIAIVTTVVTAGCGGGGGSAVSAPVGDSRAFLPNYATADQPLYHWRSMPVTVAFSGPTTHQGIDLKAIAIAGFNEWTDSTGGMIRWELTSESQAGIVISFPKIAGRPSGGQLVGLTSVSYSGGVQTSAAVSLYIWDGMTAGEIQQGLKGTATHEFGHALGIHAHSPTAGDAMYYAHGIEQALLLSERDVNTVKSHYSWLFTGSRSIPAADPFASVTASGTITIRCPAH